MKFHTIYPKRLAMVTAIASALINLTAGAQQTAADTGTTDTKATDASSDQIQKVIITASKRKEDASKVPMSVTAISGDDLTAQHINDFADVTRSVPNVSFSSGGSGDAGNGPGLSNIEIRGISSAAGSATVGIYMDDVSMTIPNFYSMGAAEPKFFDLNSVEVLRGPQGTLYGASSMGGTIKFNSNQPNLKEQSTDIYTEVSSTKGGGSNYTANGVFNAVLIPNELAFRIGIEDMHTGGYIQQISADTGALVAPDINWEKDSVLRMAMKWAPTKDLTITPAVFYQEVKTGDIDVSYLSTPTTGQLPINTTIKKVREPGDDKLLVPSLTVNYSTNYGDITSVTSFFQRKFTRTQDASNTDPSTVGLNISPSYPALAAAITALPSAVYLDNSVHQFSEELRMASKAYDPSVSPFTWLAGAFVSNVHSSISDNEPIFGINSTFAAAGASPSDPSVLLGAVPLGFPNDSSYSSTLHYRDTQQSVFGEANYYFVPTVHATFGLRYVRADEQLDRDGALYFDNYNDGNNGVEHSFSDTTGSKVTPKLGLTWEATPTDTLYTTAGEGFRLGGGNIPLPEQLCGLTGPSPLEFKSDSLWSYEVGNKSRFLNNHLSINTSLFYVNWKDMQQQIFLPCGFGYNTNVGNATTYGAEIEIKAKPISNLTVDFAAGYTHATLSDNAGEQAGLPGAVAGADIPGVPSFNVSLGAQYNFKLADDAYGFVRAADHVTDSSYGGFAVLPTGVNNPDYRRPAYSTADFSTGVSWGDWEASFFVKNLTDNEKVIQHPVVQATFNEAYRITPRTIGVSLSGKF